MNKQYKTRRLLSLLLVFCMMLGAAPTAFAHAEGEEGTDHEHDETPYAITIYNKKTPNKNGTLTYTVTCHEDGTVSELHDVEDAGVTAVEGDLITLYPTPNDGYVLSSIGYAKAERVEQAFNIKSVDAQDDGSYTFTMPGYPVCVGAAFYAENDYYVLKEAGTSNSVANVNPLHLIELGLNHAWLHESANEISVDMHLDARILEFGKTTNRELTFRMEIREVGDSGFVLKGSKEYTRDELKTLVTDKQYGDPMVDEKGRTYYYLKDVTIPVDTDKDFTYAEDGEFEVYCTAMYTLDGWTNAIGAPYYRWAYSGGDRAFILEDETPLPPSMVYFYNLDPETYHGALAAEAVAQVEEEMGIKIDVRYFTPENMTECIGYLAEWPGYESFGELGVDRHPSEKTYKKKIVLYCSLPSMVRDKLGDYIRETGVTNLMGSKLTAYGAAKSFEEFYKTQETEASVFTAALSLSLLTYETYTKVPESEYGEHELWAEFKAASDEAKAIIDSTEEQEDSVYTNARLKLLDVYLRIIGKVQLTTEFKFLINEHDDNNYIITVDQSNWPEDLDVEYRWYDTSTDDHLIIPKNELYKVRCSISATDDCPYYGFKDIRLAAPAEMEYTITSYEDSICVAFSPCESLTNTPEPITYIAELYADDTLVEALNNETAEPMTFSGLSANTSYTLRLYAINIVGRTTYMTETAVTACMTVDGQHHNGSYSFDALDLTDTSIFENGAEDAYMVTIGDETRLVGDTTLENWVGSWETWQKWIYPDAEMLTRYPYLEEVWETAFAAYIKAFEGTFMEETIKAQYKTVDDLKQYWYDMTYTNGVANILVEETADGYVLTWQGETGLLASDSYTMTGKVLNGLEGAEMYVFTADTLTESSPYKYLVTMVPDMEGSAETPIARHYHFQFGSDLEAILAHGQLNNGLTYDPVTNRKISDMVDKYWYATMTDADASDVAKYNVILGMHRAEKWSTLPETEDKNESTSGSSGSSNPNSGITGQPAINPDAVKPEKPVMRFSDVAGNAYYADAVLWAVENEITTGTSAHAFSPDMTCNRAQAVTFLWRASGSPAPHTTEMPFADVDENAYYYNAVLWAVENGITSGTSAATFGPNDLCSRGQIVTFLWRTLSGRNTEMVGSFADVAEDAYYAAAVRWAVNEGITNGTTALTFSPSESCTRAQIVTFLYRCMAK